MFYAKLIMAVFPLLLATGGASSTHDGDVNLQLRLGSSAHVTGSTRTPFIRLYIENAGSEVVFVDLSLTRKAVSFVGSNANLSRSTIRFRDATHGARVCVGVDDIVAIEPGGSAVAVAALPGRVNPGQITVAVRIEVPTNPIPDLCAGWPKKTLEAKGTVVIPERSTPLH
jgi:hypothetical protein